MTVPQNEDKKTMSMSDRISLTLYLVRCTLSPKQRRLRRIFPAVTR